jgi:hypothetical protein
VREEQLPVLDWLTAKGVDNGDPVFRERLGDGRCGRRISPPQPAGSLPVKTAS